MVRLYRFKNTGLLTVVDSIIRFIKPPKKFKGTPKKLLFIRNDKIGDAVVTLPVLRDLKLNYPGIELHVLCSETNYFILKNLGFIDKVFIYDKTKWNGQIKILHSENYDALIDLVSMNKKIIWSLRRISKFRLGSRLFGLSWLYTYYLQTGWVSESDKQLITKKIEYALTDCFGFEFTKRDTSLPFDKTLPEENPNKEFDILVHLGTSELRKLDFEKEKELIESLKHKKLLITDSGPTERFTYYKNKYSSSSNISFRLYPSLEAVSADAVKSRLLLCYDGGQSHYLSQFVQSLSLAGSINPLQWSPYEFEEYKNLKIWPGGVRAIQSKGNKGHIGISFPIWCCPCFGIGCNTKPCINNIEVSQVTELILTNTDAGN